jgi:hypothetical protein
MKHVTRSVIAAVFVSLAAAGGTAQASLVGWTEGIDCGGDGKFGVAPVCAIPAGFADEIMGPAPLIARFAFVSDGNGGFLTQFLGGAEFSGIIESDDFEIELGANGRSGTWSYSPTYGQPLVSGFVVQEAGRFALYTSQTGITGGWDDVTGLVHVSFYDRGLYTTMSQVPAPTPLALLAAGAGLLLLARQRNRGVEGQRSLCAPVQ